VGAYTYPIAELRTILRQPEDMTVSEWCDENRQLSSRYSSMPGRFSMAHTPYMREPTDAHDEPNIEALGFLKCSRVGGTEWLNNGIAHTASERPMPMGYAQPEKDDVVDEFRGRLRSIFEESERLRPLIPTSGSWVSDNHIRLNTCDLYGAWATNPGTMKRKTWGRIYFDEIDNSETVAGRLGNTLDFLIERVATFGHRGRVILDGTPTDENASGWQFLLSSDYRKPYVPCPYCGHYQVMAFGQIKLKPGHELDRDSDKIKLQQLAGYECIACKTLIEHAQWHRWMIDRTVWIPKTQKPSEPLPLGQSDIVAQAKACGPRGHKQWKPRLDGTPPLTRRRGYWINVLYSPWATRTWSHILARFFECKTDREKLRVFTNSWLAEPWRDAVEKTDVAVLRDKMKDSYPGGDVGRGQPVIPAWVKILLMGADVQGRELRWIIRGWGPFEKSALILHGFAREFDELYRIAFHTGFQRQAIVGPGGEVLSGGMMRCHAIGIDSGHRRDEVYEFARLPGVTAVKGVQTGDYRTKPSKIEFIPGPGMQAYAQEIQLVNTTYFKTKIVRLANLPVEHQSAWLLPAQTGEDYLAEFCAEHQVPMRVGGKKSQRWERVWVRKSEGAPNEAFDCEVYGAALADILRVPLMRDDSPVIGVIDAPQPKPAEIAKPAPQAVREIPRGFLGRR